MSDDASLHERLNQIDRRIRIIGRAVILIEACGVAALVFAGCRHEGINDRWSLIIATVLGIAMGWACQREFDRVP